MQTASDESVFYYGRLAMKILSLLGLRMEQHLAAQTAHNDRPLCAWIRVIMMYLDSLLCLGASWAVAAAD
eukprot:scaffold107455_cov18-Prasinocladus_malaysianus.AAC.1